MNNIEYKWIQENIIQIKTELSQPNLSTCCKAELLDDLGKLHKENQQQCHIDSLK